MTAVGRPSHPSGEAALNQHGHRRVQFAGTINALRGLLKIFRPRLWNIYKLLRIAINQREPRTLDLNHHPMPAPERVINIGHLEVDRGWLIGRHRLGLFKAVAELRAKRLAMHQLLITAHLLQRWPESAGPEEAPGSDSRRDRHQSASRRNRNRSRKSKR